MITITGDNVSFSEWKCCLQKSAVQDKSLLSAFRHVPTQFDYPFPIFPTVDSLALHTLRCAIEMVFLEIFNIQCILSTLLTRSSSICTLLYLLWHTLVECYLVFKSVFKFIFGLDKVPPFLCVVLHLDTSMVYTRPFVWATKSLFAARPFRSRSVLLAAFQMAVYKTLTAFCCAICSSSPPINSLRLANMDVSLGCSSTEIDDFSIKSV